MFRAFQNNLSSKNESTIIKETFSENLHHRTLQNGALLLDYYAKPTEGSLY